MTGMIRSARGSLTLRADQGRVARDPRDGRRPPYRRAGSPAGSWLSRCRPCRRSRSSALGELGRRPRSRSGYGTSPPASSAWSTSSSARAVPQEGHQFTRYSPLYTRPRSYRVTKTSRTAFGQALVQGEALPGPVAGGTDLLELGLDDVVVLVGDLPGLLHEFLPAQLAALYALGPELLLHHVLGGDAGVVGPGHPEGGPAEHAIVAYELCPGWNC